MSDKKDEIKIIVAGTSGIGKSTVAMVVQAALQQANIDASLFDIEEHNDEFFDVDNITKRIDAISKRTKVRIEVARLKRPK